MIARFMEHPSELNSKEQAEYVTQDVERWNEIRKQWPDWKPDLSGTSIGGAGTSSKAVNLSIANLNNVSFTRENGDSQKKG